ncbi:MAG: GntR family transcriptional regulator [Candidatus Eremiobacteraeota bacterium]|nr:GntR family transcriptional regulator [Candidatus Eremiobacteraeota bacterium]
MRADTPIYLQVADDLARDIAHAEAGTALPSETELARERGVHRQTARAALEELERRYLVRREQGRRSLVARRLDYRIGPDTPPSWTETIRRAGATPTLRTESLGPRKPPSWVRERLAVGNDAMLLLL